jgi:hypothetical protein
MLEEPNHKSFMQRIALIAILASSTLAIVSFTSSQSFNDNSVAVTSLSTNSIPYVETKGRQPIKSGCVNLYGSDWEMFPNTRAVIICDEQTFGFSEAQINDIGFAQDDPNHGISYVETGDNAWVTLYTGNDYEGSSMIINPNKKVWLQQVSINGGSTKWNDKVRSVYYQGHQGALVSQITHIAPGKIPPCADHCVLLYASDPFLAPLGPQDTTALVVCGDPMQQKVWKFSNSYMAGLGFPVKLFSLGVSYVTIGEQVQLQMFSGDSFDGNSVTLSKAGDNIDLSSIPYPEEGQFHGWNDKPSSFIITLKDV